MLRTIRFLLFCCFVPVAWADPAAIARLGTLLQGMRQVEGEFTQRVLDERGELVQESSGRLLIQHPGRFRWETIAPFRQLLVSDGEQVWQYDPDLQQVVIRPLDRRADQLPSLLLSGDIAAVERLFEIALDTAAGAERFVLTPREAGGAISAFALVFRDGRPARLELADGMGQRTDVEFSAVAAVAAVAPDAFHFVTPPGVDELVDQ